MSIHNMVDKDTEQLLNILANEYKEMLLDSILDNYDGTRNIDKRMIIEKDQEVKNLIRRKKRNLKREQKYKVFSFAGVVYILLGTLFYGITNIEYYKLSSSDFLAMAMITTGIIVVAMSYILRVIKVELNIMKKKDLSKERNEILFSAGQYIFLEKWIEFERIASETVKKNNNDISTINVSAMIKYLAENGLINREDEETIRKALSIRNTVVHSENIDLNFEESEALLKELDLVIRKIQS